MMLCIRLKILKTSSALALTIALCLVAAGQNLAPAGEDGIVVRNCSCYRERPGWDGPNVGKIMTTPIKNGGERVAVPAMGRIESLSDPVYWYIAKVENAGHRVARAVVWEYRVTEKATHNIIAHRFRSELKLKPGGRAELKEFSYEQPSPVVSANSGGKKYRETFEEAVVILRVEYSDGSAWEAKLSKENN
jgi:hypothetical protein